MNEKIEVLLNEKSNTLFDIVKFIAVPITIALSTYLYTISVNKNNVSQKYIEIATNILKESPSEKNEDLRKWAIEIINKYSDVKLKKELKQSLIKNIKLASLQNYFIIGDLDNDNDGMSNSMDIDDDNDGMPDSYENSIGLNPLDASDAYEDINGDGVTNLKEYQESLNKKDITKHSSQ